MLWSPAPPAQRSSRETERIIAASIRIRSWAAWWPVLLLGWATIGAYGVAFYSFGVLIEVIHLDTGWSLGALSTAFSISSVAGAAGSVAAGRSVDRFGGAPSLVVAIVAGGGLLLVAAGLDELANPKGRRAV